MKTDQGSYDYVEIDGERRVLAVGFLGGGGSLVVELKKSHSQQPLPRNLQPELPLDGQEHRRQSPVCRADAKSAAATRIPTQSTQEWLDFSF